MEPGLTGMLDEDFFLGNYDVFISSSREESKDLALIRSLYQAAMQNGTKLSDIATIISLNSVESIKSELKLDEKNAEAEEAASQREMQMQERALQSKEQSDAQANELEMVKMDLEKYKMGSGKLR